MLIIRTGSNNRIDTNELDREEITIEACNRIIFDSEEEKVLFDKLNPGILNVHVVKHYLRFWWNAWSIRDILVQAEEAGLLYVYTSESPLSIKIKRRKEEENMEEFNNDVKNELKERYGKTYKKLIEYLQEVIKEEKYEFKLALELLDEVARHYSVCFTAPKENYILLTKEMRENITWIFDNDIQEFYDLDFIDRSSVLKSIGKIILMDIMGEKIDELADNIKMADGDKLTCTATSTACVYENPIPEIVEEQEDVSNLHSRIQILNDYWTNPQKSALEAIEEEKITKDMIDNCDNEESDVCFVCQYKMQCNKYAMPKVDTKPEPSINIDDNGVVIRIAEEIQLETETDNFDVVKIGDDEDYKKEKRYQAESCLNEGKSKKIFRTLSAVFDPMLVSKDLEVYAENIAKSINDNKAFDSDQIKRFFYIRDMAVAHTKALSYFTDDRYSPIMMIGKFMDHINESR